MRFCAARLLCATLLAALLTGCAGVLPAVERTPTAARVAAPDSPLGGVAREAGIGTDESGVWPLLQASFALDARLAMIESATTSLDLQYYLIGNDSTGRLILRALRDAAQRGVRVRLLVDDLYTADIEALLLGLAATPNVQVRLFNPFVTERSSSGRRLLALFSQFKRLNHRMHNKLFVADGVLGIVGGRNLADDYFLRGTMSNFIDFDLMLAGSVVGELNDWFDLYWNSPQVYPVDAIVRASGGSVGDPAAARLRFEADTREDTRTVVPVRVDSFGAPAFTTALAERRFHFMKAESQSYADSPNKIDPANFSIAVDDTLAHRFLLQLSGARREAHLMSPYFIPGKEALERIAALRADGVQVRIVTNTLAVSDEPLVSVGLARHQIELLKMGVELYELSSNRLKLDSVLRGLLGSSTGRLHAKLAFIDRRIVMVGSMNLDPRSSNINTEVGVRVDSAELAEKVLAAFKVDELAGVYQVTLRPHGMGVRWTAMDGDVEEELDTDPDTSFWQRVRFMILSWFVPESQL